MKTLSKKELELRAIKETRMREKKETAKIAKEKNNEYMNFYEVVKHVRLTKKIPEGYEDKFKFKDNLVLVKNSCGVWSVKTEYSDSESYYSDDDFNSD